jgi:arsenite methyltransferase
VLLKELPDSIKNSIEAYVGCLSGAIMKREYMKLIEKAGFRHVRVMNETSFPIDLMANDPTAKAIIKNLEIPVEAVREIAGSVASIVVHGSKPN